MFRTWGRSASKATALPNLERLVVADVVGLAAGKLKYTLLTNAAGRHHRRPDPDAVGRATSRWW